jgi:branched-chain amino acid transport system substrate-binding protein
VLVGASLPLTGALRRQGEQAHQGLRLWADWARAAGAGAPPRLVVLDDGGRRSLAEAHARRLLAAERVDALLGPYSSGLVLAVAPLAAAAGAVLWNHGGTSDAILRRGWRHVVTVPSPASDYLRGLPARIRRLEPRASRIAILHARAGTFAAEVARGAAAGAIEAGFAAVRVTAVESFGDAGAVLGPALDPAPDLLVSVGAFRDDVAVARRWAALPARPALAVVGAGLAAFGEALGDLAEGVWGPSQWEPLPGAAPALGPDTAWFLAAFEGAFGRRPEYPAAQAFATGVILDECRRRAGGLESAALLEAARGLDARTFFGGFRLDPGTGRQVSHAIRLVQWRDGRKQVVE